MHEAVKYALEWIGKSLRLAVPEGFIRIFLDESKPLLDLLPKAGSSAPEFVDSLPGQNQPEQDGAVLFHYPVPVKS